MKGLCSIDRFTYTLETRDEEDNQKRGLQSINNFTYTLETDKEDEMG